jgi:hypothetical protein
MRVLLAPICENLQSPIARAAEAFNLADGESAELR